MKTPDKWMLTLSKRARNCMMAEGIFTKNEVRSAFEIDDGRSLLAIKHIGKKTVDEIAVALTGDHASMERAKGDRGHARTELVAIRFDPELKARMEKAAQLQRRSTANFVEWAIELVLDSLDKKKWITAESSSDGVSNG